MEEKSAPAAAAAFAVLLERFQFCILKASHHQSHGAPFHANGFQLAGQQWCC